MSNKLIGLKLHYTIDKKTQTNIHTDRQQVTERALMREPPPPLKSRNWKES